MAKLLLVFLFILSSNYLLGQENIVKCNKKILGQWELQSIRKPFRQKPDSLLKICLGNNSITQMIPNKSKS